jgi:hypothetical protein
MTRLQEFIEALTILGRYDSEAQTGADHDQFWIYGRKIKGHMVSPIDTALLSELGFEWDAEYEGWRRFT